jgi:hypothetical protein
MHGICPRTAAFGRFRFPLGAMSFSKDRGTVKATLISGIEIFYTP